MRLCSRFIPMVVIGAILATPAAAGATAGESSFAVRPTTYDATLPATKSYFVFEARPGQVFNAKVRVTNTGGRAGTALVYPVDATTGQTSGTVYRLRTDPRTDVGSWIQLQRGRVTLDAGSSVVIPFSVTVPRDARGGDHIGGIVAENAALTRSKATGALQIQIRHLTIAAVVVQVRGSALARLAATGLRAQGGHGYQYLYLHLENLGGLAMKPRGRVVVTDPSGAVVATRSFQLDTFVPGTAIDYPVLLPKRALSPGVYQATVELSYRASVLGYRRAGGQASTLDRTFNFTVSRTQYEAVFKGAAPVAPPRASTAPGTSKTDTRSWLLAAVALVLAGTILVLAVRRRRARRTRPGAQANGSVNGAGPKDVTDRRALIGAFERSESLNPEEPVEEAAADGVEAPPVTGASAVASVASKLVDPATVECALAEHFASGRPLSKILVERGYVEASELEQLFEALPPTHGSARSSHDRPLD
jgi:hypothetical protein